MHSEIFKWRPQCWQASHSRGVRGHAPESAFRCVRLGARYPFRRSFLLLFSYPRSLTQRGLAGIPGSRIGCSVGEDSEWTLIYILNVSHYVCILQQLTFLTFSDIFIFRYFYTKIFQNVFETFSFQTFFWKIELFQNVTIVYLEILPWILILCTLLLICASQILDD